jgi:peroxiredoxin
LQQAQALFHSRGVKTYAVSASSLPHDKILARQRHLTIPLIHDGGFHLGQRFGVYGGTSMPMDTHAIFVINPWGTIVFATVSPHTMHIAMTRVMAAVRQALAP